MRVFHEPEPDYGRDALTFALGAVGGLTIGVLLSRQLSPAQTGRRLGSELRERARTVARRLRPDRLRRMAVEQEELSALEDAVLDAFLADDVLSERGIDVGAISPGIIELSGSVRTEAEADHAIRVANATEGVRTVVNRLDIEDEVQRLARSRRRIDETASGVDSLQHGNARVGGMGRRRQGRETDPDRPDESQHQEQRSLREADRQQWLDEQYAHENPATSSRPEIQDAFRTRFDEDELDNQDPHNKHAARTLDDAPQELNSSARVGEGLKSGEHLRLEKADVPLKPHGGMQTRGEEKDKSDND